MFIEKIKHNEYKNLMVREWSIKYHKGSKYNKLKHSSKVQNILNMEAGKTLQKKEQRIGLSAMHLASLHQLHSSRGDVQQTLQNWQQGSIISKVIISTQSMKKELCYFKKKSHCIN